jgi:hypothetical protein
VKDEAPSEVVVISPVLRQRVADVISGNRSTGNAIVAVTGNGEPITSAADETWTLERLPAPDPSYLAVTPPESSATALGRRPMVADIDDEDDLEDSDEGPAGSEPLHVTLARMNRKASPGTGAGPSGSIVTEEARPAVAVTSPAAVTAPTVMQGQVPVMEASPSPAAPAPAPRAKVNPLMVKANPLLAKPAPAPAPKPEAAAAPEQVPGPAPKSGDAATPEPAPEVVPATPERPSEPAPAATPTPVAPGGFVNKNPFA